MDDTKSNEPEIKDEGNDAPLEVQSPEIAPQVHQAHLKLSTDKQKRSKKSIIFIVIFVLIVAIVAGAWYLLNTKSNDNDSTKITTDSSTYPANSEQTTDDKLFSVAYAYGDAQKAGMELFWRPVNGGDRRSVKNIGQNNYVTHSSVYQNKILVVTTPSNGSSDGSSIWLSDDSGQTYDRIFSLDLPVPDSVGPDITSAVFSKDGSKIAVATLKDSSSQNIIKEIDLSTSQVRDVFSSNSRGIFLQGYDSQEGVMYYFNGCYYCDGNRKDTLFEYNLKTKAESKLYAVNNRIGISFALSHDYSKLLTLYGVPSNTTESIESYELQEFEIRSKTFKNVVMFESKLENAPQIGYRAETNDIYFSEDKSLFAIQADGTRTTLYKASKPIHRVIYVGDSSFILAVGLQNDYQLSHYKTGEQSVDILSGDQSTTLFGVTQK